jgi:UDP-2,4-diacetamido-2,4,6-trideoxy-beta-L-altropyranose hydrolase
MGLGTLLIRADASPNIGAGHIMRCIALAEAWKKNKGDVVFVSAAEIPFAFECIRKERFRLELLTEEPGSEGDALSTKAIAEAHQAGWVVIDGYHFSSDYFQAIRTSRSKILLIDDEGDRDVSVADVVLNQNLHATAEMYPRRECTATLLLGTRFVLLRQEFTGAGPEQPRQIPKTAEKILVAFGGGMPPKASNEILAAVEELGTHVEVAVAGAKSPQAREMNCTARVNFLGPLANMAPLMAWADLAVSAAGSTSWELCRLGVPSILIDFARNQRALGQELGSRGIAMYIPGEDAHAASVLGALNELVPDDCRRREMSKKGMRLIDGRGVQRVVAALRAQDINLRPAIGEDAELLWNWRNDPVVRSSSFSSQPIAWEEHCNWMAQNLRDDDCQTWVAEEAGCPLATLRLKKTSEAEAELGITIAPEFRGQGLAPFLIRMAVTRTAKTWGISKIRALIKPQNLASIKAFEDAGFEFCGPTKVKGYNAVRYVACSDCREPVVQG